MTVTVQERMKGLREPFSSKDLEWRVGRMTQEKDWGRALPYLTFRAVADRLDTVLGAENWTPSYVTGPAGGVVCRLSIRIDDEWVTKENGAENTDLEGVKGGLTDSLKRAAAMWGIGRYLYAYEAPWVALDERRRMVKIPRLPDEMLPEAERGQPVDEEEPATEAVAAQSAETETAGTVQTAVAEGAVVAVVAEVSAQEPAHVETSPQSHASTDQQHVTSAPESKGVATVVETAPESNPSPAANADIAANDSDNSNGAMPEGLSEADVAKVSDILARAQKDVPILALKNYVNGKGKDSMSEPARVYLLRELDKFAA